MDLTYFITRNFTSFAARGLLLTLAVTTITAGALGAAAIAGCRADSPPAPDKTVSTPPGPAPPVVEVRTTDYAFHAPSEIRSGWTTFRMTNGGQEPHFLILWRLPDDRTFDDYASQVIEPFVTLLGRYKTGELTREQLFEQLGGALPDWLDLGAMGRGGPGFLSPGRSAETTVELEPGSYVMECYMVNADGAIHNDLGMLRPLTVTEESTGASPPEADVELTLANYEIRSQGELEPGENTIRVRVADRPEGLLGHDIHLARLDDDTDLDEVTRWMDWVDGLTPPAPVEFLGGAEQVAPGEASYLTVDLEPGRYAWISEGYASQGMIHEVSVE